MGKNQVDFADSHTTQASMIVIASSSDQPDATRNGAQRLASRPLPFSLVVATKGRVSELVRLFDSLAAQTCNAFNVVVVDQNTEAILAETLAGPWPFDVQHIRTPGATGACRARNVGWRVATGALVLFPDDDCWYPPQFLEHAHARFNETGCAVLTGRAADTAGRSINGRFELDQCVVKSQNVWTTSIEWVAFFKRSLLEALGGFDEDVGIGSTTPWQSCESQDIVLRALEHGAGCVYDPSLFGHHAELNIETPDEAQIRKGRAYARGMGWVLRKHKSAWPARAYWVLRPACKSLIRAAQGRPAAASYYRNIALGRLEGARGRVFGSA